MDNQKYKGRTINIELKKHPEFGTTCNQVSSKNYFVPMIPMIHGYNKNYKNSYLNLDGGYKRRETFFIFIEYLNDQEQEIIKIEIKLKNILKVEVQTQPQQGSKNVYKTFYFNLNTPPKIFKKISKRKIIEAYPNYSKNFAKILDRYDFTNHYHFVQEKIENNEVVSKILTSSEVHHNKLIKDNLNEEKKKFTEKEMISFEYQDLNENDYTNFIRVDSYLSTNHEYTNFYLLNLIMKIKIKFCDEEECDDFIRELKFDDLIKEKNTIYSIPDEQTDKEITSFLGRKTHKFYKDFLNFHFNLQYAILCLITTKKFNIFSFDIKLIEQLAQLNCDDQTQASILIEHIIKEQKKLDESQISKYFTSLFESSIKLEMMSLDDKERQNLDKMKTRTIEITPSMIYYKPPIFEKQNHILRKYAEFKENFLKVNFVDEEGNKIFWSTPTMWVLINFIKKVMLDGIIFGSRLFKFLSASNSQMKNSSWWFFCLEGTKFSEIEKIIKELGDFSKEQNIHKNAARRGQCLSATTLIKKLSLHNIKYIEDIQRNNYVFTDGIGQVSLLLAQEIAKHFKLEYASAFQIRIGGIKGIVAVNPDLKGEIIAVRPSMIKFESDDTDLGVIRCSNFSQGYLNRQIITLLYSLGVPKEILMDMLRKDLDIYDKFAKDPNSTILNKTEDVFKKCYYFTAALNFFAHNDYQIKSEPFLSNLVCNLTISKILDLKTKGKILDKCSATLVGVIDETDSLEEGEVFISIKKDNCSLYKTNNSNKTTAFVIQEEVIVSKNPCLHPGDLKVLKANHNCTKLSHMVNVIVFSAKGQRPIQNEISGGDLDGDSYFVSWNQKLVQNIRNREVKSMEESKMYFNHISNKIIKEIKMKDIVESYLEYMKNDTIAIISNAHSAFADSDLDNGAFNEKCIKLSELFSIAIDAPKHGNFVRMEEFYKNDLLVKNYPDFLEVNSLNCYESPGILGQLYRKIDVYHYQKMLYECEYRFNYLEDYILEQNFIMKGCENYVLDAFKIYMGYQASVKSLMIRYRYLNECELFLCENIHDKKLNKQNKHTDIYTEVNNLKDEYTNRIKNKFKDISCEIASAFYLVSYLNTKSVMSGRRYFLENNKLKRLVETMIDNGMINKYVYNSDLNFEQLNSNKTFQSYMSTTNSCKENRGVNEIVRNRRIFSLPWLIKEIRDRLFYKSTNNY